MSQFSFNKAARAKAGAEYIDMVCGHTGKTVNQICLWVGLSASTVGRWIKGHNAPTFDSLLTIEEGTGVPIPAQIRAAFEITGDEQAPVPEPDPIIPAVVLPAIGKEAVPPSNVFYVFVNYARRQR